MPSTLSASALLERVCTAVRDAGAEVMRCYNAPLELRLKADGTPATQADANAERLLVAALHALAPEVPVVAEESHAPGGAAVPGARFWLVDPLDGTKEFVSRNGEFTVNVALIDDGQPVLGVVFAPALNHLYAGAKGRAAFVERDGYRTPIAARGAPECGLTVVSSRSHGNADALATFLDGRRIAEMMQAGSSLKLCLVAEGRADCYPRLGRTMEWDIAAGHAVLDAAGGRVETLDGSALRYGKPAFENPHFAAWGCR